MDNHVLYSSRFAGQGVGPAGTGVVTIGTRTLSESGTVGAWDRTQVGRTPCHHLCRFSLSISSWHSPIDWRSVEYGTGSIRVVHSRQVYFSAHHV